MVSYGLVRIGIFQCLRNIGTHKPRLTINQFAPDFLSVESETMKMAVIVFSSHIISYNVRHFCLSHRGGKNSCKQIEILSHY